MLQTQEISNKNKKVPEARRYIISTRLDLLMSWLSYHFLKNDDITEWPTILAFLRLRGFLGCGTLNFKT